MRKENGREIRDQLLAEIHLGHLRPGDRLPSMREISRRTRVDPRSLARVYRELESEGLIEIRGRSGVFLSREEEHDQLRLGELERWAASVALQGWTRRLGVPQLALLMEELTCTIELKCLVVESSEDQIGQFAEELHDDFGLAVTQFNTRSASGRRADLRKALHAAVAGVDLVATTVFHGALVADVAEQSGRPHVVITMNDLAVNRMQKLLEDGPFTLVALDPQHEERVGLLLPKLKGEITVVPLDVARKGLPDDGRVFITRAARRSWVQAPWPLLFPYHLPIVCSAAASELCSAIVAANMASARTIKQKVLRA